MNCRTKVGQVFNNNPHGSRTRGRPNNRRWNCVQTDSNKCNIKNWKKVEIELCGCSPLRRRKFTWDCSAVEEEEGGGGGGGGGGDGFPATSEIRISDSNIRVVQDSMFGPCDLLLSFT
jgi:hypothetical protein